MKERMFPILGSEIVKAIPWDAIAPYEAQAKSNHGGQTLERLAQRGGLGVEEACAAMEGASPFTYRMDLPHTFWCARLLKRIHGQTRGVDAK